MLFHKCKFRQINWILQINLAFSILFGKPAHIPEPLKIPEGAEPKAPTPRQTDPPARQSPKGSRSPWFVQASEPPAR